MPDVFRVQRPRLLAVGGALDDGSAVGEDGKFVLLDLRLEEESVEANAAGGAQLLRQFAEVELAGATLGYLHGIAAAQAGRLCAVSAFEPFELPLLTAGAI